MKEVLLKSNGILIFKLRVFENECTISDLTENTTSFWSVEQGRNFVRSFREMYKNTEVV